MTLIVALLTPHFVLLASDRRVTRTVVDPDAPGGQRVISQEDTDTKTSILNGRYLMGFAGLARIRSKEINPATSEPRRQRIESWLMDTLAGFDPDSYFAEIADRFGPVCEQQHYNRRHTFLAAGWPIGTWGTSSPEIVRIDNRTAAHSFYIYRRPLGTDPYLLEYAGWLPPASGRERLEAIIGRNIERFGHQPKMFANLIRKFYRRVSPLSDGRVGSASLISTLPRVAVPVGSATTWMEEPTPDLYRAGEVSWFYPEAGSGQESSAFQPAFIGQAFVLGNVRIEYGTYDFIDPLEE